MEAIVDDLVIKKLALEAFEMVLEGETGDASKVFSAINQVKPGNRPSALGFALIDYLQTYRPGGLDHACHFHYDDLVMCCLQGLTWVQQGRITEARALLETVSQGGDSASAEFARHIISYEIEGR